MEKDMNMQDKELDALFRDRLDNLEMEPSANLWAGIAAGLDTDKKKKPVAAYLSIAATIIVLITAGILFMPKAVKVIDKPAVKYSVAKPNKPVKAVIAQSIDKSAIQAPVMKNAPVTERIATTKTKKIKAAGRIKTTEQQPVQVQPEPEIAAVTPKVEILKPVVPDNDVPLNEKTISPVTEPFETKPVVLATTAQPQADAQVQPQQPVKKKRINSFGGLLNALVAKIDKRKDKLIEFSDADENNITGVNLGILKIKKEEE